MLVKYRFLIIVLVLAVLVTGALILNGKDEPAKEEETVEITVGDALVRWDIDTEPLKRDQLAICGYGGDMGEFFWYKAQELYGDGDRVMYDGDGQINFANGYVQSAKGTVTVFNRLADGEYFTLNEEEIKAKLQKFLEELGLKITDFEISAVTGGMENGTASKRASVTLTPAVSGITADGGCLVLGFHGNEVETITAGYKQLTRLKTADALSVDGIKASFSKAVLNVYGSITKPARVIVSSYRTVYLQDNSEEGGGKLYPYIIFEGSVTDGEVHNAFSSAPVLLIVKEAKK